MRPCVRLSLVAAAVVLITLAWWLPSLGDAGLWSSVETPILDRARAALGESVHGLERSPWLPDALRTASYAGLPSALGLRLPHTVFTGALLALVATTTWAWTRSAALAAAATLAAAAMPQVTLGGHTALGNPFLEVFVSLATLAGLAAMGPAPRGKPLFALVAVLACVAAVSSGGLLVGAGLPLFVLAIAPSATRGRWTWAVRVAAVAVLGAAAWLIAGQGEGYIPVLGAARDLGLEANPQQRRFAEIVEELIHATFPWIGCMLLGATRTWARPFAIWVAAALVFGGAQGMLYGPRALPWTVPAAVLVAAGLQTLLTTERSAARRWAAFVFLGATLLCRQDASLHPAEIALPAVALPTPYPVDALDATAHLQSLAHALLLGVALAAALAWPAGRRAKRRRDWAIGIVCVAAVWMGGVFHRALLPETATLLSPKTALERFAAWSEAGVVPTKLVVFRAQDPGLRIYGPPAVEVVRTQGALQTALAATEPRAALVRQRDVAALAQGLRARARPFYVLDTSHQDLWLVGNVLPPGAIDQNPLHRVRFDAPPKLEHATLVGFDNRLEIVGWEVDAPLVRGRTHTLRLAIRVLDRVSASTAIYSRFIQGRLFHIHTEPEPVAEDIFPAQYWRPGDVVVHEVTFRVPPLEIGPGRYDFIVGIRKNEQENYPIVVPAEAQTSDYGVVVRGKQRTFAKLGEIEVW